MRVQGGHWLDYDPIALAVLIIGIGVVTLLALSIWARRFRRDRTLGVRRQRFSRFDGSRQCAAV